MILIILLHFSYLGMGLATIRLFFKTEDYSWHLRLPLSYFVGAFIHVIILHVAIVAKLTSPFISWALLIIGLLGVYEIWLGIKKKSIRINPINSSISKLILNISIIIMLIPVIYLISLKLISVPDVSYDSTAFWNLKAKYFFYGEHLWSDAFMDTNRIHANNRYPLYMPIFTFEHYSILGVADDFLTKPGTLIYYFAGMFLFFLLIRQWAGTTIALLAIAFMLYTPLLSYHSIPGSITTTYVDFPLSMMIVSSVGLFLRYLFYRSPVDLFGAMVTVSSAILQKQEGMVWFALFFTLALMSMLFMHKKLWLKEYTWFILPLAIFIGWYLIRANLPIRSAPVTEQPNVEQLYNVSGVFPKILFAWVKSPFKIGRWGLIPFFVIPAFVVGLFKNLRNLQILPVFVIVLGYLGVIFFTCMLIEIQSGSFNFFMKFTYERMIIHILPVSLLLAIVTNSPKFIKGLVKIRY